VCIPRDPLVGEEPDEGGGVRTRSFHLAPMPPARYPIARLLWVFPLLLIAIAVSLTFAGLEQREVARSGEIVPAEVLAIETQERSEITRGHARLRYTPPGAATPVVRDIELPLTFLKELEEQRAEVVDVRLLPGRDQVVFDRHARGQYLITLSFAGMAFVGALGLAWMVGAWNRYLRIHGDPAHRPAAEA
jgi:hypothetical protein